MNEFVRDMPRFKNRMERIDRERSQRLREAKDTRNFKVMIQNWSEAKLKTPSILSDNQRMAIYLMTDFSRNYGNDYIASRIGIRIETLLTWKNSPLFIRELDKEITRRRSFIRLHAFRNVNRAIMRGSMKDTWNYLKMTGDLREQVDLVDRTGERELSDKELRKEIRKLNKQVIREKVKANEPEPSFS